MPAPVIVTKDVGGFVADYQAQTAIYRVTGREVRLHECRSACTLALSLPNVCVYPDSVLKFHQAYDPRDRQANAQVSQQLFASYPAAVQARLGTLTREYKVLRGSELIALGIRNCNEPKGNVPRIMVASAPAKKPAPPPGPATGQPLFAGLVGKMLSVFGIGGTESPAREGPAASRHPAPAQVLLASVPRPPPRPAEFAAPAYAMVARAEAALPDRTDTVPAREATSKPALAKATEAADGPLPPHRPAADAAPATGAQKPWPALPKIITGAQPILPPGFSAYADLER